MFVFGEVLYGHSPQFSLQSQEHFVTFPMNSLRFILYHTGKVFHKFFFFLCVKETFLSIKFQVNKHFSRIKGIVLMLGFCMAREEWIELGHSLWARLEDQHSGLVTVSNCMRPISRLFLETWHSFAYYVAENSLVLVINT